MHTEQLLEEIEAGQGRRSPAPRRVPRTRQDKPVSLSCLVRWVTAGVIGPNGERIKLEAARMAGRWITSPGAIRRFIEAQTLQASADRKPGTFPRTPRQRSKAAERAAKQLEEAGI